MRTVKLQKKNSIFVKYICSLHIIYQMSLLKFINIPVFIISLAVGFFFVYIYSTDKRKIYVYPTPDNVDTIQYKDQTGTCFEFKDTKVTCPKNDSEISKIPAQL